MFNKLVVVAYALVAAQTVVAAPQLIPGLPDSVCLTGVLSILQETLLDDLDIPVIGCATDVTCTPILDIPILNELPVGVSGDFNVWAIIPDALGRRAVAPSFLL